MVFLELWRDSRLRRGIQDASCVGPGKSNVPLELRRKAGDCSRVTAGQIDLIQACVLKPMFHSRGDTDLGVAFQSHPGFQASSGVEAKISILLSSSDAYLLEPTEWPKRSHSSYGVWREELGLCSRPWVKRRPSSRDYGGVSGFFSSGGPSVGFLTRYDAKLSEPLVGHQGSPVSVRGARGIASLLSTQGSGIGPRGVLRKDSGDLSRVEAGNPGFPRLVQVTSGGFSWWL